LFSEWISTNEASMSKTTGPLPVMAGLRRQTSVRTLARAATKPARFSSVISWIVRATGVSEGTAPKRSSPVRR